MKVYLAGPVTGLTYKDAKGWRNTIAHDLPDAIKTVSPMRGMDTLKAVGVLDSSYEHHPLTSARGINTRCHWDVKTCDVVFVNFLGATKPSLGTTMEVAWAHAYGTPVIMVIEEEGNPHDHAMVRECATYRVSTLEEGLEILKALVP